MELSDSRHSRDGVASQLRELLAAGAVYIDKTVHVANAETVDRVGGMALPLGSESVGGVSQCLFEFHVRGIEGRVG